MPHNSPPGRVVRVDRCELTAIDRPWPFAGGFAEEIDAHWRKRVAQNPKFFNGRIRMLSEHSIEGGVLSGQLLETGFKEFLYWRETGEPEAGVTDAFASAVIWSSDNAVLLCRQQPGHINTGLSYLPGGFIDPNDVAEDGRIDIAASSEREVKEETGLSAPEIVQQPGFLLTFTGRQLSIGVQYRATDTACGLRERVLAHIGIETDPELADVVMVSRAAELETLAVPDFARLLLQHVLS